jgi:thiamine-phosphate pyrophosphorylase
MNGRDASNGEDRSTKKEAPFRLLFVGSLAVSGEERFEAVLEAAIRGGADAFLLREQDLGGGALLRLARVAREITARSNALLLVSERLDVALASGADGVQLPENSFTPQEARAVLGRERLIGRSVHDRNGALRAEKDGADFVILGPVFPTPGKERTLGPSEAGAIRRSLSIPAVAIGGIDRERLPDLLEAGFESIAVIRALAAAPDPEAAARDLRRLLDAGTP